MNRAREVTWNPLTGCTPISEGCEHCYARRMANRLRGRCGYPANDPFRVVVHQERIEEPLRWRRPKMVFVCSMGDLFHPDVSFEDITRIFDVMAAWRWPNKAAERRGEEEDLVDPGHTFQVLTKRPERIHEWLWWLGEHWPGESPININLQATETFGPNIWVGVTTENQRCAKKRIPVLLQVPAAVRFVSLEPLLGSMDQLDLTGIDWVIVGGERGPGARPMDVEWVRSVRDQCVAAGVPFFFKRWRDGSRLLDGQTWEQYPILVKKQQVTGHEPWF